jgi:hypothetical protein
MANEKIRIVLENECDQNENRNMPAKILFSTIKVANNVGYRFLVVEFGNGERRLFIERLATKRLPRGFVSAPPAPLTQYVRKLKEAYGIE